MKESRPIVKVIVYAVIAAALVGIGMATGIFSSFENAFQGISLSLSSVMQVILMAAIVLAVANLLIVILSLIRGTKNRSQTFVSVIGNVIRYAAAIIIICWGLKILGADIGTVVAGIGIVALIIGFGANSLIADLVTGIFMIFENQYNVGDYVEVGGFRGKVTSIGIRTTCLEDGGGNVKIINNSSMTNILNRSDHASKAVSVIGMSYDCDLPALEAKIPDMMHGIYEAHSDIMLSMPQYLGVEELAESSVNLKFVVEVEDTNIYSGGRILNRELFLRFKEAGVEVPFPQLDIHQK